MPTIGQKVHYCEGGPGTAVRVARITQVHSEECVNLEVLHPDGTKVSRSSVVWSKEPSDFRWGWWTEPQIKEWEVPGSASGALKSADFRRVAPAPAVLEAEAAPQFEPTVVTAGPEGSTVEPPAGDPPPASEGSTPAAATEAPPAG